MIDLRAYIEERSIPEPNTGCWIWLLSCGSHGYGNASTPWARVTTAHRVSFIAFVGSIPVGMLVEHSCDNAWCVAPHHLRLGTDSTNAIDKQLKGRAAKKLTDDDVRSIRLMIDSGSTQRETADLFGVDQKLVHEIVHGRIWWHVQ